MHIVHCVVYNERCVVYNHIFYNHRWNCNVELLFILIGILKKMFHVLSLVLVLKQQFNYLTYK